MFLGRISTTARLAALRNGPMAGSSRGFSGVGRSHSPSLLSLRMDSLFVKCTTSALIYFVPQDLVFLAGLFMVWHGKSTSISPCKKQADVDAAVEEFKAKKGLDNVSVYKGRSTWHVS